MSLSSSDLVITNWQNLFERRAQSSPHTVALICKDQQLTYQELDNRSNQLAAYLRACGVKPDMLVGVCLTRSLDMVVAVLGVIKAGGAYIPLDPTHPVDRLLFMLDDAQAQIVITHSDLQGLFNNLDARIICLDIDAGKIGEYAGSAVESINDPCDLAYVIYTSGSTGKPKGVMVTHANVINFVEVACSVLDVMPEDVYLQSATIAYALSVRQIMIPLAVGATVVIAASDETRDPLALFELIKRRNITLIDMVPSFWRSCLQRLSELPEPELNILLQNSLRRLVSIGEALMSDLPRDWVARFGDRVQLVNIFGQTETTGIVAAYPIPRELPAGVNIVPIGRSAARTKLYILDADLQPLPDGEVGELCISNPCLARGYLNHADLTAEKFVSNAFGDGFSERLYRTGDMARYRPDGNIEFLGRGDHQVKIRGQRLELGEVEAALREHPGVRDCAVIARGNTPDEKYLAAYIVQSPQQQLSSVELKNFMRLHLPEYMIPAVIVFLEALPLNTNGKLNRLALPEPQMLLDEKQFQGEDASQSYTLTENSLIHIWQNILKLEKVGIHDNFFDLGGDSLKVVRLFSQLENEFGMRFPVTTILQSPTIARLAEHIKNHKDKLDAQILIPIQTNNQTTPFFCVHGVGGGVLGYRDLVSALGDKQPFYGLQAIGLENKDVCDLTITEMATRYVKALRTFQKEGPYRIGGYCFGGVVAYEMACQLEKMGEQVSLLAIFEGFIPEAEGPRVSILQRLGVFFKSVPVWVRDYTTMSPADLKHRVGMSISKLRTKMTGRGVSQRDARVAEILETDITNVPERNIELTQIHSSALRSYQPEKYKGSVTLFRARNRSFNDVIFGSLDPQMGWGDFAMGGVSVRFVDGFHRNIHLPPYVTSLAAELGDCLNAAQMPR